MTETKTEISEAPKGCRFPLAPDRLCGRPVVATSADPQGRGAPSRYCDDPGHNRAAAWRARRAFDEQQTGEQEPQEVLSRPVTSAGARAGEYLDQTRALAETLAEAQQRLLRELATLGDPDAVAVELGNVTADAQEQLAVERRRAAQAEAGRREDRARAEEANAAAVELAEELEALRASTATELAEVRADLAESERNLAAVEAQNAEQDEALNEARLANGTQFAEIERLAGELRAEEERSTELQRLNDVLDEIKTGLETDLTRAQEENRYLTRELAKVTGERDEQRRRAESAELKAELATAQVTQLREDVTLLRGDVEREQAAAREYLATSNALSTENAGVLAQLEAAKQALAAEQNHANQRVGDMERAYERQLGELRAEVERLRNAKK